jgi:hypothetical protein
MTWLPETGEAVRDQREAAELTWVIRPVATRPTQTRALQLGRCTDLARANARARLRSLTSNAIRYDNLRSAVSRVLFGRARAESQRWVLFRSTMGFEAFYCMPGIAGAHEKGGVEGDIGRFRRNHLVPVPEVASLSGLRR